MEMMYYQFPRFSHQDSLKILEADIQHANALWALFFKFSPFFCYLGQFCFALSIWVLFSFSILLSDLYRGLFYLCFICSCFSIWLHISCGSMIPICWYFVFAYSQISPHFFLGYLTFLFFYFGQERLLKLMIIIRIVNHQHHPDWDNSIVEENILYRFGGLCCVSFTWYFWILLVQELVKPKHLHNLGISSFFSVSTVNVRACPTLVDYNLQN